MSVYRPKGSPYWHFDFQINGVRFHGSCGTKDNAAAKKIEAKKRTDAAISAHFPEAVHMKIREAFGAYWKNHAQFRKSARDMEIKLERIMMGLGPNRFISEISNRDIAAYIAKRREQVANASVNRETELIRAAFIYCRDRLDAQIGKINWKDHKLDEPKERTRCLSDDEEKRLFENIRPDFHPFLKFCLLTGCRVSSARGLTWGAVKDGVIRLYVKSKVKGDFHELPVTDLIGEILDNVRGDHPIFVFTYKCAKSRTKRQRDERYPFSAGGWRKEWARALEKSEIKDFRFHDLRHTAGTRIRRKHDLAVVKKVLGHSDIASTLRYAHVDMDDISRALSRNSPERPADVSDKIMNLKDVSKG